MPQASGDWGWGTTVVLVTSGADPNLFRSALQLRRRGFTLMLIATDQQIRFPQLEARMASLGVPSFWVTTEEALDRWR